MCDALYCLSHTFKPHTQYIQLHSGVVIVIVIRIGV